MSTTVKCSHCGKDIKVDEALRHELEEKVLQETHAKHTAELVAVKEKQEAFIKAKKAEMEKFQEETLTKARDEAIEKVRKQYDAKISDTKAASEEAEKQNKLLQEEMKGLLKQLRESKNVEKKLEIEFEKKMLEEQDKIKIEAKKEVEEELSLEVAKKEKKLQDAEKQIKELQRRIQQGSQQMQGEIHELQLEEDLKTSFPFDVIGEVPKGIRGADILQTVQTRAGTSCGTIVWEVKNTKTFSQGWITKLKNDQRQLKAELAILVTTVLPEGIQSFGQVEGVWVCDMKFAVNLSSALRHQLIKIKQVEKANSGKATKAEVVYDYLISNDFKQRIEVWVEYFSEKRNELEKEKRYFMKRWEKEEKQLFSIMQNTAGIYGDLQGLIGSALPKVQSLELPEEVE